MLYQRRPASLLQNSPFVPVCSCGQPLHRRGDCLTFPLSRDATSAYFLPLFVSYLFFVFILDPSVFLADLIFWPFVVPPRSVRLSVSLSLL